MKWWLVAVSTWMLVDCDARVPTTNGRLPPRPANAPEADRSKIETFAIDRIFVGDRFGYDIDGKRTDVSSKDVCEPQNGAPQQPDGLLGVDNNWSTLLAPSFAVVGGAGAASLIANGAWSLQIRTRGLPSVNNGPVLNVGADFFGSAPLGHKPMFEVSADWAWPVLASSTVDGTTLDSKLSYEDAYVTKDGTFVSGTPHDEPLVIPLAFGSILVTLRIHHAVITFQRDFDAINQLNSGIIAGVLDADELIATYHAAIGATGVAALCGPAFDGLAAQITAAQDILSDGTNTAGVACNAISIGLGFTAWQILNPTQIAPDPPVPPDTCATDAGNDAADAGGE